MVLEKLLDIESLNSPSKYKNNFKNDLPLKQIDINRDLPYFFLWYNHNRHNCRARDAFVSWNFPSTPTSK